MKNNGTSTAVEKAYDHLLSQTIGFQYHPGEKINEVELATTLGMSRAPIREALNRLVVAGLASVVHGKGFCCRKFSATEFVELYEVRFDLEIAAIKKACTAAADQPLKELLAWWKTQEKKYPNMSLTSLIDLDELFHIKLSSLAENSERINLLESIYKRIRFIRKINLEDEGARASFISAHSPILTAVAKKNGELAEHLLSEHLSGAIRGIESNIQVGLAKIFAADIA